MKKYQSFIFLIVITLVIFFGCQKTITPADQQSINNLSTKETTPILLSTNGALDLTTVKEAYAVIFKNSKFWQTATNTVGDRTPVWDSGKYVKTPNLELLEFPVHSSRQRIIVDKNKKYSIEQIRKIASASIRTISFVRNDKGLHIIERLFVPDFEYLQQKGGNIKDSRGLALKDFIGKILRFDKNDNITSTKEKTKTSTKTFKVHTKSKKAPKVTARAATTLSSDPNCYDDELCEYTRTCVDYYDPRTGAYLGTNCENWEPTTCWTVEVCDEPDQDPCSDDPAACACGDYGICDDNYYDTDPNGHFAIPLKLCGYYKFKKVGNSYTGEIRYLQQTWKLNQSPYTSFTTNFVESCLTVPVYSGYSISEAGAADYFNACFNYATKQVLAELNAGTLTATAVSVYARMKALVQANVKDGRPGSVWNPGPCIGPVSTEARTSAEWCPQ
ncbi:hypothetical protein [Niabella hirudinis]|uniref:hypothetical protein n=1 Tax=Niabella hirudinis TaxID=1285929 RepID=UPI003EB9E6AC